MTRREKPWVRTRIVILRPGVPGRGYYRPELRRPGVPGRRHCRPKFPTRLPTGWHRRLLILLSNTPQTLWRCSGSPRPIFRSGPLRRLSSTACHILAEQFMLAGKARLFKDHRAVELIMSSPDPSTHKRGVRNFDSAAWGREKQNARVIWQLRRIHAEPRHETSPFQHWQ